jgi:Zn-finger nucleic acid-binding protein
LASLRPNSAGVTDEQISLVCPHCQAELAVRVEVKADVAPPLRLRFEDRAEFEEWLRASGLTLDEFETLPVYEWYREELEPLVRASRASRNAATPQAA